MSTSTGLKSILTYALTHEDGATRPIGLLKLIIIIIAELQTRFWDLVELIWQLETLCRLIAVSGREHRWAEGHHFRTYTKSSVDITEQL